MPYSTGFEAGEDDAWVFRNGTNAWLIGNATHNGTGTNALYISQNGTANTYNTGSAAVSYAFRTFDVTTPGDYYCTWSCLRTFENSDKGEIPVKLSEKSMAAIKIAMEGGDPAEYLKGQGSKNPSAAWCSIKAQLKEKAPELLQKVMDAKKAQEPAADLPVE